MKTYEIDNKYILRKLWHIRGVISQFCSIKIKIKINNNNNIMIINFEEYG